MVQNRALDMNFGYSCSIFAVDANDPPPSLNISSCCPYNITFADKWGNYSYTSTSNVLHLKAVALRVIVSPNFAQIWSWSNEDIDYDSLMIGWIVNPEQSNMVHTFAPNENPSGKYSITLSRLPLLEYHPFLLNSRNRSSNGALLLELFAPGAYDNFTFGSLPIKARGLSQWAPNIWDTAVEVGSGFQQASDLYTVPTSANTLYVLVNQSMYLLVSFSFRWKLPSLHSKENTIV